MVSGKIFSLILSAASLGVVEMAEGFQYNFYSDTSCQNYVSSFTGENDGPDGTTLDVNGYIGSVLVVAQSDWTTEFDYSYDPAECLYFDYPCARGAPSCINRGGGEGSCLALDQNVGTVWAGFTVCDQAGFDASYKRSNWEEPKNGTLVVKN